MALAGTPNERPGPAPVTRAGTRDPGRRPRPGAGVPSPGCGPGGDPGLARACRLPAAARAATPAWHGRAVSRLRPRAASSQTPHHARADRAAAGPHEDIGPLSTLREADLPGYVEHEVALCLRCPRARPAVRRITASGAPHPTARPQSDNSKRREASDRRSEMLDRCARYGNISDPTCSGLRSSHRITARSAGVPRGPTRYVRITAGGAPGSGRSRGGLSATGCGGAVRLGRDTASDAPVGGYAPRRPARRSHVMRGPTGSQWALVKT